MRRTESGMAYIDAGINSPNRSISMPDSYPFALSAPVLLTLE